MSFFKNGFKRRVLSIILSMIMTLSVCIVGITPAFAADVTGELADVGASGSGTLNINGATITINGSTVPATSGTVKLNFSDNYEMVIVATKKGQYFLKWEITGGTEGVDYKFAQGSARKSTMQIEILTDGIHLTIKPTFTTTPLSAITFAADTGGYVLNGQNVLESFSDSFAVDDTATAKAFSLYQEFEEWTVSGGVEGEDFEFTSGSLQTEEITVKVLNYGADITFTAHFTDFTYTVVFEDYDGTVLSTQTVIGGQPATPPEAPARVGYAFAGWNKSYSAIGSDITITATYRELAQYTVELFSSHRFGGTVEGTGTYYEGVPVAIKAIPYDGYTFAGWDTTTIGGDQVADVNAAETTVTLTMDNRITAYFEKIDAGGDDRSLIDLSEGTDPYVYASKSQFRYGEPINIVASGGNWVGIYTADTTTYNNTYSYYYYTEGLDGQAVDVRTLAINSKAAADPSLELGAYKAVLFGDSGYTKVLDTVSFDVIDEHQYAWSDWNRFSTDKKNYEYGESIMITGYTDRPELSPWFAVVKKGSPQPTADNFSTNVLRYAYLAYKDTIDRRDAPFDLIANSEINKGVPLEPGEYDIWLFRTDSYLYPRGCSSITVHPGDGTVTTEKDTYNWYEDISVTVDYTNYADGAWVGIFKMSEINGGAGGNPTSNKGMKAWFDLHTRQSYVVDLRTVEDDEATGDPFTIAQSYKGEYGVFLFDAANYNNVVASTTFTLTNEADAKFCDGYYKVDNLTDGFANGHIAVELDPDSYGYIGFADLLLYWADENGKPLEEYAPLHKAFADDPVVEFDMYPYTFIPEGAKKLAAYVNVGGDVGKEAYVIDLPSGCLSYEGLDEGVLSEFQMLSDIHIYSANVTHYSDGSAKLDNSQSRVYSHAHFQAMLKDIANMSPSSSGIFINGDIANNGFAEEYAEINPLYNGVAESLGVELPPLYINFGNHDSYVGTDITPYINFANSWGANITQEKPYYVKEVNGYKYIFLAGDNSDYYGRNKTLNPDLENYVDAELSAAQLQWLDEQLAESKKNAPEDPVFVMLHQPIYQTVYGTYETDAGVVNYEELKAVLNKYNNVIYLSGHSHYELNTPDNIYGGDATRPVAVNTSSLDYPWTVYNRTDGGGTVAGVAEGFYVKVYEDKVVFLGRDFTKNLWVPSASYVIYNKDVQLDDTATMYAGDTLTADDYNLRNPQDRTITYTSSDTSIATVDADGNINALKAGEVTISVLAAATDTEVITREEIVVTVKNRPDPGDATVVDLIGLGDNWTTGIGMVYTSSTDVVTAEVQLSAGVHRFKIRENGVLYGNDGIILDTTKTTSDTGWLMLTSAGEGTLYASGGTYVFDYTISTDSLVITYTPLKDKVVHDDTSLLDKVLSGDPYVHTDKDVYDVNDAIYVVADHGNWVGLYDISVKNPTADDHAIFWYFVEGNEGAAVDIRTDNFQYDNSSDTPSILHAGDYAVYLFDDSDNYSIVATDTLTITDSEHSDATTANYVKSAKSTYIYYEDIYVTADVTSAYASGAWVGVYPAGSDYTKTPAKYMYRLENYQGEKINLTYISEINTGALLPAGNYDIYLFGTSDFSKELDKTSIDVVAGVISTDKDTYSTFSSAQKTENVLVKAETYDSESTVVNDYIMSTVSSLIIRRSASASSGALATMAKGQPYKVVEPASDGWVKIEYATGKYGYCAFECITRYETTDVYMISDATIYGSVKYDTTLYADYDKKTKITDVAAGTPVAVITNDSSSVKVQVGGMIGYIEYYHLDINVYPHTTNVPAVETSTWVGIYPANVTPGSEDATAWYYHYYDDGVTNFNDFCNTSVSLRTIAQGDGSLYGGADTLPYLPAGEYTAYLFGDSGYTNILDSTNFTAVENDMEASCINGLYDVEKLADGFANGTVYIELGEKYYSYQGIADMTVFWADENGQPLERYTSFAGVPVNTPVVSFHMQPYSFIPEGAASFAVYVSCGDVTGETSFKLDFPEGCLAYTDLDENITSEFQVISDTKLNASTNPLFNEHFKTALADIANNSANSLGIFIAGDITANGNAELFDLIDQYREEVATETGKSVPTAYITKGNSDKILANYVDYVNNHGGQITEDAPYYSLMMGGNKYIFITGDVDDTTFSAAQLEWLDAELLDNQNNNEGKPVFILNQYPVAGTTFGDSTSSITNIEDLSEVVSKYNNVIMLCGQSLCSLNLDGNTFGGNEDLPVTINAASTSRVRVISNGKYAYDNEAAQGLYVMTYEDKTVFMGRDFVNNLWIPEACCVIYNEDVSIEENDKILEVGNEYSVSEYLENNKDRDITISSSDPSVAEIDENGNITAVSEGVAYIDVFAKATNTEVITREKLRVVVPVKTSDTITYLYKDRNGKQMSYSVPHTFTADEILGFEGNDYVPYSPACKSGKTWINSVLYNAPFIAIFTDDITWEINSETYDPENITLTATQTDRLFTVTCQVGDKVEIYRRTYNELVKIDARQLDSSMSEKGFWYKDVDDDGKYTSGTDLMLTYGPYVAYRVTGDMNINYELFEGKCDFNITIDSAAYGRQIESNADGSNSVDKVTVDYTINILTPFFYGENSEFVPSENVQDDPTGQHVTIESLRNAGYDIKYGVVLEQVGSFAPGSALYPYFSDALEAAKGKNYGKPTDSTIITEVVENYTKPVMSDAGTYCIVYDTSSYALTNKNRFNFSIGFNNTEANQKKFFNVYSYVTVTTPEKVKTTYISNVQTLNIYEIGQS